jgi:hypothetical protein
MNERTAISVFIDDTHVDPKGVFAQLADFCIAEHLKGKVSLIPSFSGSPRRGRPLGLDTSEEGREFLAGLRRLAAHGFDVHMELMTHDKLWDFETGEQRRDGPCEGIWLYDPTVHAEAYEKYFSGVLDVAAAGGVAINGISVPGCDCEDCASTWAAYETGGHDNLSSGAWQALLNLARRGRFGVPVVAVYSDEMDEAHPTRIMRSDGGYGVYDCRMDMSVQDQIGFSGNDADFYISADGRSGRIVDLVTSGATQCFFCSHWFSMNPTQPKGWETFRTIIRRINDHLDGRIEWMTPSDFGKRLLVQKSSLRD